ncbi:hypothetical protein CN378_12435 [Bacillus sp. AFS015802]|uniref:hypothetical protein n=1 Tax=Bacillus sp. AFS015802 TaxID=2033486 RepID=UPI000BF38743|nr:hypothetical protein [Bacillus sp. AFS015802]PFA66911.1 hypothetical protein CN378_12435 [Bacillus sp. AFS015802]
MGKIEKGRSVYLTNRGVKNKITWIQLKSGSNVVFSTSHYGNQRVIYYLQDRFTILYHDRKR